MNAPTKWATAAWQALPKVWRGPVIVGGIVLATIFAWRSIDLLTARSYGLRVKTNDGTSVELTPPDKR